MPGVGLKWTLLIDPYGHSHVLHYSISGVLLNDVWEGREALLRVSAARDLHLHPTLQGFETIPLQNTKALLLADPEA